MHRISNIALPSSELGEKELWGLLISFNFSNVDNSVFTGIPPCKHIDLAGVIAAKDFSSAKHQPPTLALPA